MKALKFNQVAMSTEMHYGASKQIFQYAETLRKNMTVAEKIIWDRVSKNQLGVKIRRQHPVWKYIADYYCHELKLIIEIDGGIHLIKENKEYDIGREITLNEFGIEIIRFTNDQVINEIEHVIETITGKIQHLKRTKSPLGDLGVK
jgi:very-short-patch-repair endonuclease